MKRLTMLCLAAALAMPAWSFDLGNHAADKPASHHTPNVPAERQGGDTLLDAVPIVLPYSGTGTTTGYYDDYDEVCPYDATSPDVVYTATPAADIAVDIDLFGSQYDTKVYVYDQNLALVACNDDFYSDYVSKIENLALDAGVQYFIVIDGYGGDHGDYVLNITEFVPCVVDCPAWALDEGEPPLTNDYVDTWNGGCNTDQVDPPFQHVDSSAVCGVSGFYLNQGSNTRDTDWFTFTMPSYGFQVIYADAELATYMFELAPQDCGSVGVIQNVVIGPCEEGTMTITGDPGSIVWFWVGPTTFASPDGSDVYMYDYWVHFGPWPTATESHSWTDVKSLFR